jgi:predicted amidohydrolase YtcJ
VSSPQPADLVLRGGVVRTLDGAGTVASALAVSGERIVAVGSTEEIAAWTGEGTRIIELDGACVLPGINDSHLHGAWLGALWPETLFGGPGPSNGPIAPEQPEDSGSLEAIEPFGEAAAEGAPGLEGGAAASGMEADHHGAQPRLVNGAAELREAILRAQRIAASLGITSYTEPGLGPGEDDGPTGVFGTATLRAYRELAEAGELTARVSALTLFGLLDGASTAEAFEAGLAGLAETVGGRAGAGELAEDPAAFWRVLGVKVFADGIPPARNAWIHGCYPEGGSGGLLVETGPDREAAEDLRSMIGAAHARGLQVAVHATGDRTLDEVAAAWGALDAAAPGSVAALRHYVIHGDLVSAEAVRTFGELGAGFNTQPVISETTAAWLAGAVGEEAAARAWPLGEVLDAGIRLALSSDAPVVAPDWRASLAAADRWMGPAADPAARAELLLHTVTTAGAWQDHAEDAKGVLRAGMLADLCVLAADPVSAGIQALPELAVTHTVVGGRVVHSPEAPSVP